MELACTNDEIQYAINNFTIKYINTIKVIKLASIYLISNDELRYANTNDVIKKAVKNNLI